jgi:hypothetical protein
MSQRGRVPRLMARRCSSLKAVDRLASRRKGGDGTGPCMLLTCCDPQSRIKSMLIYQNFTNFGSPSCHIVLLQRRSKS